MKTKAILAAGMLVAAVASGFGQPVIINPPQWQTNAVGSTAIFSVEATGAPPLYYQWRFNGVDRAGATDATLLLSNTQPANQGLYSVVVTNVQGAVTSIVARLYVIVPPDITTQPSNQTVDAGGTAVFAVVATGTVSLRYQWRLNGVNLQTKTNTTLSLVNVGYTNTGGYTVVVTNAAGAATSQVATLTVVPTLHGFSSIRSLGDQTILLTLTGHPRTLFTPYFDLFPVETSADLATWTPLVTLLRTNASTNAVHYWDSESTHFPARFYRTATNHLITPIAKPTGPFAVGKISFLLNDPSRTNRYNIPTNSSFMVSYWYPAEARAGQLPGIWEDRPLAQDPNYWGSYTDRVPYFVAHSLPAASISAIEPKYPVIIYVPGWGGTRAENLEKFEDLASHGYIVISADTWEGYGTVFPDGTYLHGSSVYAGETSERSVSDPVLLHTAFDRRIQDVRLILADLDRGDSGLSGLASHADTNNVGLMGFSFGGAVVGETCRTNDRYRVTLFVDGGLGGGADEMVRLGLQKPWLRLSRTELLEDSLNQSFFAKATNNAVWLVLSDAVHASFAYGYETTDPSPANRELQRTMKAYIVSFFNKYLKNQDDHLLDGPSTNFPRVLQFMRK